MLEIWAGLECTLNRVRDEQLDQLALSGHLDRLTDLDLLADLGVSAVRYPVLWERVERDGWGFADERLGRLRELGIRPIVGLVHHGSGPLWTSLVDESFAPGLTEFARQVARRYPWVDAYTPVNEPNTTARFSCLYGHWYPHLRDGSAYARALVEQCRATVLAMRAIREVRPDAQLVQTDDLGKTWSTPELAYQAEHENERRWATWDLLCGRVDGPFFDWMRWAGVDPEWFRENACPPDVVGVNHYLSGERFLDHRVDEYPPADHGSNGRDRYADVLAARVAGLDVAGPEGLLREASERYGLPLAVTEAHNGSTRDEQLRWLDEVVRAARAVPAVQAVCVWSLLGTFGWATLCADGDDHYEPGVFDLRAPAPRPTALAHMTRALARDGEYDHPVLDSPGWWRRPERLRHPQVTRCNKELRGRAVGIAGATGTLGCAFARICAERGLAHRLLSRSDMDIAEALSVERTLDELAPWAVINTAGYVRVDDAETDVERCRRENVEGPRVLAEACAARGIPLVTFSSDLVFSGDATKPYVEHDTPAPLNVYGHTKAEAERAVLAAHPGALVVRTSAFFGPWDEWNFVTIALRELAAGRRFTAADDVTISPTYVPDLVHATLDHLIDGETGLWHVATDGAVTWAELARAGARAAGVSTRTLVPAPLKTLHLAAARPRYTPLTSARAVLMPPLDDALARYSGSRAAA